MLALLPNPHRKSFYEQGKREYLHAIEITGCSGNLFVFPPHHFSSAALDPK